MGDQYAHEHLAMERHHWGHIIEEMRLAREAQQPFWVVKEVGGQVQKVTPRPGSVLPLQPNQHVEGPFYGHNHQAWQESPMDFDREPRGLMGGAPPPDGTGVPHQAEPRPPVRPRPKI